MKSPFAPVVSHLPAALFCALLMLPWLWAYAPGPSPQVVPLLAAWTAAVAAACVWAASARVRAQAVPAIAIAWFAAAGVSCLIALLQWFGLEGSLPGAAGSSPGEAFGNLRQRNQFATLTSIGLIALFWLQARSARRWPWMAAALLLALGCAASVSRTGLVQWVLICGFASLRRESRPLALAALAAYALGALGLPPALAAFNDMEAPSMFRRLATDLGCSSRTVLWSNVAHLIALRPWTGWGAGELDYAHFMTLYPGERFCDILDNAHNLPLHIAVEFGVPLALAVCGTVLWLTLRARPWAERDATRLMAWGVLGVIGLHSLLEYPLWYGPFQLAALLSVALLLRGRVAAVEPGWAAGVLAAAALCALAWAFGCYDRVSQAYLQPEQRRADMRAEPLANVRPGPFQAQAKFAELSLMPVTRATALRVHELSTELLHYSPEPRLVEKLIESSVMTGRREEALLHLVRFRAAFPADYRAWSERQKPPG